VGDVTPVTDDNLLVEFTRDLRYEFHPETFKSLLELRDPIAPYLHNFQEAGLDKDAFLSELDRYYQAYEHVIRAQGHSWQVQWNEAIEEFNRALEIIPDDDNAKFLRALAYHAVGGVPHMHHDK